jgi:spermidine/putrescine transport system substrate-binding protein
VLGLVCGDFFLGIVIAIGVEEESMKWLQRLICLICFIPALTYANDRILNIYAWTGEIPDFTIRQFEKETGIKVNFSTYENNEIMYAKLHAANNSGYDLVLPSSYFVDRMRHQNMLETLDKSKIPNWKNLNPAFLHAAYDPESAYSVPHIWGITGIFVNNRYHQPNDIKQWSDLWDSRFHNQLLLIDDMREVFSMALLSLGYSANDSNPDHIKAAYLKLKALMPNVKVFSSDALISIMIDEDAHLGMAWNGDAYKATKENPHIDFVFPKEGFVIWVDNFVIPKNAPHKDAAYAFINFLLRVDVAKAMILAIHFPTANLAAQKALPANVRNSPVEYPSAAVLSRGQFQLDLDQATLGIYEKYWEALKMSV